MNRSDYEQSMNDKAKFIKYYNDLINEYINEVIELKKHIQYEENSETNSEKDKLDRLYKRLFECGVLIDCFKNNIELLINEENIKHYINIINNNYDKIKVRYDIK